ncbi:MAG: high-affinity branched-chain amino acid ABC transporter ATP-binding protein LivG [Bordetella sp.]|nr:MAG: high-affinity branched-chain amino acid ABC transporter ATP-binding protein LivG [Bordetella sp.]
MNNSLLNVTRLTMRFGGLLAIDNVGFDVKNNEIFSVIGPNGAGKTTVFNCISGFYKPNFGSIFIGKNNITGKANYKIARYGLVRTFQNIRLFKKLTSLENLLIAQHMHIESRILYGLLNLKSYRLSEKKALINAKNWLNLVGLTDLANREAGSLAYGHQKQLEIARCMITNPKLLMLDEPAAGLNPYEKNDLQKLIHKLRCDHNVTILLIEHDMSLIMNVSDRILVMENGRSLVIGSPKQIRNNQLVIKAYLGDE